MITSPHNDKLKEIRRLNRRREARFVAEGEDLVHAAERAGWRAVYRLTAGLDVEPDLLDEVSSLGSGTRVVAVYERRWAKPTGPLCVALWGVRDPGNVGTVVRAALAFGAASVALGPDCADPFSPKAVRASMGAIFELPVAKVTEPDELPGERIALAPRGGEPLSGPLPGPVTIVVGAERAGLPAEVLAACDRTAHIPIVSDSLNAAMAATVALYELTRGERGTAHDSQRPAGAGSGEEGTTAPASASTERAAPAATASPPGRAAATTPAARLSVAAAPRTEAGASAAARLSVTAASGAEARASAAARLSVTAASGAPAGASESARLGITAPSGAQGGASAPVRVGRR